jgi:nucleotide-binding universal stress UspA family protein
MKILVGYDGSQLAQRALAVAQKRAKAMEAELYVFTAAGNGGGENLKHAQMQSGLKEARMMCTACKIDCKIEMSQSNRPAAEELIRFAKENKVDEIVIGLSKRSQLGKLLFGSTSRQVLLEAPCPVLTVR